MRILHTLLALIFILSCSSAANAQIQPVFSPQEQQWIRQHPTVTYTVKIVWPQEYEVKGEHVGLSRDFLDDIEQQTGIHFVYVAAEKAKISPPMMISSVLAPLLSPQQRNGWLFTSDWMSAVPMLIARNGTNHIRNMPDLNGKTVAVIKGAEYEGWLHQNYPKINLLSVDTVKTALESVEKNQADAALGSGLIMLPIYQRLFSDSLSVASQVPEMASGINMAVSQDNPMLLSILNKALANMTARDVQNAYIKWFGMLDVGSPSLGVVLHYYWWQLALFITLMLALIFAVRSAWQAKRRAQKSEADKSAFLAMMSHEIRTPMNALVASLELLRHSSTKTKQVEYTDLAISSSKNLLELLNDVLDHSKMTQKNQRLERHALDIGALLEAVGESQRPAAESKGLTLLIKLENNVQGYWIIADSNRLRQIVNNLLSNAIKFTERGSVTLQAALQTAEGNKSAEITLSVIDTGIGIPDEAKGRLFKAWQQVDSSSARQHGGSGLGLYISHELVKAMQGSLSFESQPGEGTTFSLTVPVEPYDSPSVIAPETSAALPRFNQQISVLVVEDHPANRHVIAGQLEVLECHYELTDGGEAALRLLEDENYYDLILLDCNLPGRDGYQVAQDIRLLEQQQQRERTPVIAISALNNPQHYERCHASGMDDVMTKPITLQHLAETISKWCAYHAEEVTYDVQSESVPELQQAVISWLLQDVADLKQAGEASDLRYMIHSIHRIKGVALMYRMSLLADYAADIEQQLRSAKGDEIWPLAVWLAQLQHLIEQDGSHQDMSEKSV
ncbi:ATP-binding protein [Pantoea dispersa]|uniref:ATP-binding protein n=1 Tax=Pantoea dispersa TaxID=59814 RepID=UPI0039B61A03